MGTFRKGNKTIITEPAVEPITLDEAMAALHVDSTEQYARITSLIKVARVWAEKYLNLLLITQTVEISMDAWPAASFGLGVWPLQSIDSIKYDDTSSPVTEQTLVEDTDYYADVVTEGGRVGTLTGWPSVASKYNPIRIRMTAGYAPSTDSPIDLRANVPDLIKEGIRTYIIYLYDGDAAMKTAAEGILWPLRRI